MDPGVIAGIIGGLIQGGLSIFAAQKIREAAEASLREYGQIDLPQLEKIVFQAAGPTAVEQLRSDPALKQAQMKSLDALQGISDAGGFNLADRAVLNKTMKQAGQASATADGRVLASMNARGLGGGGQEFLTRQLQNQQYAERESDAAQNIAGQAQARALDAIMARGRMAGDLRGQDWNENLTTARAHDDNTSRNRDEELGIKKYNNSVTAGNNEAALQGFATRTGLRNAVASGDANMLQGAGNMAGGTGKSIYEWTHDKDGKYKY